MGENEQGGMLRTVVVVGLVALIAAVITMGVVGLKASMTKNTDSAVGAIAKENGLQDYGRNYLLNSKHTFASQVDANDTGWVNTSIPISMLSNKVFTISVQVDYDNVTAVTGDSNLGLEIVASEVQPDGSNKSRYLAVWRSAKVGESFHGRISETFDMRGTTLKSIYTPNHWAQGLYIRKITATNVSVSNPKLEMGDKATDWTPAPED